VGDPVEAEYDRLLAFDDEAQEEMDRWIREADALGPDADSAVLQRKIDDRITAITRAYAAFLEKHPTHARARIAFGSFLNDTGQESGAKVQWEKALELDPKNPAVYNNLAGYYGHHGPITNAFTYFEKAIELDPEGIGLLPEPGHDGVSVPQGRDGALRDHRRAEGVRQGAGLVSEGDGTGSRQLSFWRLTPPRPITGSSRPVMTKPWRRGARPTNSPRTTSNGKGCGFTSPESRFRRAGSTEARTKLTLITNAHFQVVKERLEKTLEARLKGAKAEEAVIPEDETATAVSLERKRAVKTP
jgi:tetratricopeptide (TPR) repeat protein